MSGCCRCVAHRLDLIATNDIQSSLTNPTCRAVYRSLMGKLAAIWNKQGRSTLASDKIKDCLGGLFVTPNETRWNATYDSMCRVLHYLNQDQCKMRLLFSHFDIRPITDSEEVFLKEYITVMKPLAMALDILQGEKVVTAGYILPSLHNLLEEYEQPSMENLTYTTGVVSAIKCSIYLRFREELNSATFITAAALHPRFKLRWVKAHELTHVEGLVTTELRKYDVLPASTTVETDVPAMAGWYSSLTLTYNSPSFNPQAALLPQFDIEIYNLVFRFRYQSQRFLLAL